MTKEHPHHLTDFLVHLANDSAALARFEEDPEAAAKAAGLSEKNQAIIKSRDAKKIADAVAAEFPLPSGTATRPHPLTCIITLIW